MKRMAILLLALIILIPFPAKGEENQGAQFNEQSVSATSDTGAHRKTAEDKEHKEIKEEDGHKDEGMHGMMMEHHIKGWWIVIGVVMVIMMGAHVAVLF